MLFNIIKSFSYPEFNIKKTKITNLEREIEFTITCKKNDTFPRYRLLYYKLWKSFND